MLPLPELCPLGSSQGTPERGSVAMNRESGTTGLWWGSRAIPQLRGDPLPAAWACAHSTPSAWDSLFLASSVPAQSSALVPSSDSPVTHFQSTTCYVAGWPQASSDGLCHCHHFACTYGILDEYLSTPPNSVSSPRSGTTSSLLPDV